MKQPLVKEDTIVKLARFATGTHDLEIGTWDTTTLSVQGRRSIFRFAGIGNAGAISQPWSFVLKQIQAPEDPDAPDAEVNHCAYWEREYLLYEAGVPQSLTGYLRAPYCLGVQQPSPSLRWIWLEDLNDLYNGKWPIEQYAKTAYHLGLFNGENLATKSIPGKDYFARHALRCSSAYYIQEFNRYRDPSIWKHPLVRRIYPTPVIETLDRLAADQENLIDVLYRMPQTFCHLDAWHGNMAAVENTDRSESTVLFDWAVAGYGAPGEEIGHLIWVALLESNVDIQNTQRLEREVFNHYLQGLEDSGCQPDPNQVRCAYLINSLLLFGFALEAVDVALDEDAYEETEQFYGKPIEQFVAQAAGVTYLLIERISALKSLLDTLAL